MRRAQHEPDTSYIHGSCNDPRPTDKVDIIIENDQQRLSRRKACDGRWYALALQCSELGKGRRDEGAGDAKASTLHPPKSIPWFSAPLQRMQAAFALS
jgi:hypothetical protein